MQANLRFPASIANAVQGAEAVVNLCGILAQTSRQTFEGVHVSGARAVAKAARQAGARQLVHVSAIGADAGAASLYASSKGRGEAAVREEFASAVIARPSIVFGPEDDFFNRFAAMARIFPGSAADRRGRHQVSACLCRRRRSNGGSGG